MKHSTIQYLTILFTAAILATGCATTDQAQNGQAEAEPEADPIEAQLENTISFDGLFTIHQDTTDGSTKLQLHADQIGKEYIYFGKTADGVVETGHFRGNFRDNKVFKIERYYDRIEFVVQNNRYYFDEDSPLSRAESANMSEATLVSQEILAENDSTFIINGDAIFLSEDMHQVKPTPNPNVRPGQQFTLGNLSTDKTKYSEIRSFPENTDVVIEYVYDNPQPLNSGSGAVTDARSVSIQFQHTFIEMPDNDYQPRLDDPRVGYFTTERNDQISTSVTPYKDMIHRWNLVKKDPEAELSEPVEPIVWWIENTTPHEFRDAIKEATLAWNESFEAAGFKNAIEVKVQPDDADWHADDIRYNVLRWTSSPMPPFGGYGPSFVNPRTGEILGSNIMLEWVFMSNRYRQEEIFDVAGNNSDLLDIAMSPEFCSFGHHMQHNNLYGANALQIMGYPQEDIEGLKKEALKMLVLHELGHTFALNHNMQGSTLHSLEDIHSKEVADEIGLTGSVMDYSSVNINRDRDNQGRYYDIKPGPYDNWAITYGYYSNPDPEAEAEKLKEILEESTKPEHAFGNDADDMRSPGSGIDPRVMIGDMSAEPIAYGAERIALTRELMGDLIENFSDEGKSYEPLRNAFMVLMGEHRTQTGVMSRYIGGVYRDRAFAEQAGGSKPLIPVEADKQKEAMEHLEKYLFAPDAFESSHEAYNYLQIQRRGFNFFGSTEDPKIHNLVLGMQSNVLAHILHPVTMQRMTDSRTYGNSYSAAQVVEDLTSAIFDADANGNVNTFRQNLQIEYVERLIGVVDGDNHDRIAKSSALYNLQNIREMMDQKGNVNSETRAHAAHVKLAIDKALKSS